MMTIWKYKLTVADTQYIAIPRGGQFLSVQMQGQDLCVWVLFNRAEPRVDRRAVHVIGTGNPIPDGLLRGTAFLGTVQCGAFVWHVFVDRGL